MRPDSSGDGPEMPAGPPQLQLDLSAPLRRWPAAERFPHNFGGTTVGERLRADLERCADPLLITGYASLESLLDLLLARAERGGMEPRDSAGGGDGGRAAASPADVSVSPGRMRLLLGVEPAAVRAGRGDGGAPIDQAIMDYWLERGISLLRGGGVLAALDLLDRGRLEVRISGAMRVHAKIYVAGPVVTLGSSNYTPAGLRRNIEGNVRFEADEEPERFSEACELAEAIWSEGRDFAEGFRALLERLLRKVTWREALARACAELLEGEWAERYTHLGGGTSGALWPAQEMGIAQAMWVLENVGSVLIADATGSGKTRLAAHLLRALQERNWSTGRIRSLSPVVVCPPYLGPVWRRETLEAGQGVAVFSHGVLSRSGSDHRSEVELALAGAQILSVDEAHNFLNRSSERSRVLYGNAADHVILLTATPINRGARDLLAIVDLLGADNFDDRVLKIVWELARPGARTTRRRLSGEEREAVRGALQDFVVRRTKDDFNALIDREPERYRNALAEPCRFPEHRAVVFPRDEPKDDRARAVAIREKAKNLRGLVNLRGRIRLPSFLAYEGWSEERFLRMRLTGARALAAYQILSRLRSSREALVEHLLGTTEAEHRFGLPPLGKASRTGDVIGTLQRIRGRPPRSSLEVELPEWLVDREAHARAVDEEIETYRDILRQAEHISDHRREANARYLVDLLERHERIIAFDSHLISLYALSAALAGREDVEVVTVTGEGGMAPRRRFSRKFALGAEGRRVIGLCSDALAEGLNLQGASAVVHLDLPSVIRVLEQRVGRVDRMDSPHRAIEVHWPDEPPEFSLGSDERLLWRLQEVEDLLGSNVPLPEELRDALSGTGEPVPVREVIDAVERGEVQPVARLTLSDAFAPVRALVQGRRALVPDDVYEALRRSEARVLSAVAVVRARRPWVFLAIGAADRGVPRWTLVDLSGEGKTPPAPLRSLDAVAEALRARLAEEGADADFDRNATELLREAIEVVSGAEVTLLPRRKRRALDEMRRVLMRYRADARKADDGERVAVVDGLLALADPVRRTGDVALDRLAEWWLELVRPVWYAFLVSRRGRKPALLRSIRKTLIDEPLSTEQLRSVERVPLGVIPLERRVVAAIVGVAR